MDTQHRIVNTRRVYNRWVASETLEDFALRFTSRRARRWSNFRVANTASGAMSFLALEAIGGAITLAYGAVNASTAIIIVGLLMMLIGLPIAVVGARHGLDIDLLTRGAGFGYLGSTITSLVYAAFTFILFAIEASIMSLALQMCFNVPMPIGYLISSVLVIPIVIYGITTINWFQLWTLPIWIVLNLTPLVVILWNESFSITEWLAYEGQESGGAGFSLVHFGAASAVIFGLMAQIGEQVDYLRFLPKPKEKEKLRWWTAVLIGGPGWVIPGAIKMLIGSFLAVTILSLGVPLENAAEPNQMYLAAYSEVFSSEKIAILITGIFVVVSQLKINITNAYAGSIAWSNFFSRLTHRHPGRVVWLVFNVLIALILMEVGIFHVMEVALGLFANLSVAWLGSVFADLAINMPLKLRPKEIEFRRAYLCDVNPVGVGSMMIASFVSVAAFAGLFGENLQSFSPFLALACAVIATPLLALITGGKYYLAERKPNAQFKITSEAQCVVCEHTFDPEDMAHCPIYAGPICSLCCSLDTRCGDGCKTPKTLSSRWIDYGWTVFAKHFENWVKKRMTRYLFLLGLFTASAGLALALIQNQVIAAHPTAETAVTNTLFAVFFLILVSTAIILWLYILTDDDRNVAREESTRHTNLLLREIRAHKRTHGELQDAKVRADIANAAKSRYMAGLSHEFRTPLNTILGFVQLIEDDPQFPDHRAKALRSIKRSGEHLAGLIDGLLDYSRIEAGRIELSRETISFDDFLSELVDMFELPAQEKGLNFEFIRSDTLPATITADRQRLKQVLINLLSNAIRYTENGKVTFDVSHGATVTTFKIRDTGFGIAEEDLERIFLPFERGDAKPGKYNSGAGLGLTITKLLVEIMGGDLSVKSEPGVGSAFSVQMMLSPSPHVVAQNERKKIRGYEGRLRSVLLVEDDPDHTEFLRDALSAVGLNVITAENGGSAIDQCAAFKPNLFILDYDLPDMNGQELAQKLRESGFEDTPIVFVSALSDSFSTLGLEHAHHDAAFAKPINIQQFLLGIGDLLNVQWTYDSQPPTTEAPILTTHQMRSSFPNDRLSKLREKADIGHIRGFTKILDEIDRDYPVLVAITSELRRCADDFDLDAINEKLNALEQRSDNVTK